MKFNKEIDKKTDAHQLISGTDQQRVEWLLANPDETLCFCLSVPARRVIRVVGDLNLSTIAAVTRACGAGGGCTSCHGDIAGVIQRITGCKAEDFDPLA